MKISKLIEMYNVLNTAKYNKLEDADKIKLWKIVRALKPIAAKFEEDTKDASERFMEEGFRENLQKAQEYEKARSEGKEELPMTEEEYKAFVQVFIKYNKLVSNAINEIAESEVDITLETLSEDAFGKLMASNDWTFDQINKIDSIVK